MNFLDAAMLILQGSDRPMTVAEITAQAYAQGLIKSSGKTPKATMSARLYLEAKRPGSALRRVAEQGRTRARRGSVRWTVT